MTHFGHQLSIDLDAPPSTVWRVIAAYDRDPEWRTGVRMTVEPAGLVRDGTVTYESLRMLGSTHRTTARICDVVPERSFRFISGDGKVEGTRVIAPCARGSRLTVTIRIAVPRMLAPLAPVLGWVFRRRVRRDLERLRMLLTAGQQRSPANLIASPRRG